MTTKDDSAVSPSSSDDSIMPAVIGGAILILAVLGLKKLFSDDTPAPETRHSQRFWRDLEVDAEDVFQ